MCKKVAHTTETIYVKHRKLKIDPFNDRKIKGK